MALGTEDNLEMAMHFPAFSTAPLVFDASQRSHRQACSAKNPIRSPQRRTRACLDPAMPAVPAAPSPAASPESTPVAESDVLCVLSGEEAKALLALRGRGSTEPVSVSVDLGASTACAAALGAGASVRGAVLGWGLLRRVGARGGAWAVYGNDDAERVSGLGARGALSLYPVPGAPPTLLVGGFGMHRFAGGADPRSDTAAKMQAASPAGRVLDICSGLGYTAIAAAREDAVAAVVTVEGDPAVVQVQRRNPWSKPLFDHPKIERVVGDAAQVVPALAGAGFDTVIHDPPALALAGELYGKEFYGAVRGACREGARLFHYVGNPASRESGRLYKGVAKRLAEAGFCQVRMAEEAFGVVAIAGVPGDNDGGSRLAVGRDSFVLERGPMGGRGGRQMRKGSRRRRGGS